MDEFGDGRCRMCNMELQEKISIYHKSHAHGSVERIRQNKKFCDSLCYAYFQKRLYADTHNIKLAE